jgi:hypothetical protein
LLFALVTEPKGSELVFRHGAVLLHGIVPLELTTVPDVETMWAVV